MDKRGWVAVSAATFAVAGFLFAASAVTSAGTDLRSDTSALKDVVAERAALVDERQRRLAALEERVAALREQQQDSAAERAQAAVDRLTAPVGLSPISGPGVQVTLTDADPEQNEDANPDDLVVHQQDLQAVVNAMWRGGAQGVQVMDQRLINTSAVRCVGNTLILQGRVYSPPFVVIGLGDQDALERELDDDDYLHGYRAAVEFFGLGYDQQRLDEVTLPGYDGPLGIDVAEPDRKGGS